MHMHHESLTNTTGYQQRVRNNVVGKDKGYMEIGRKAGGGIILVLTFCIALTFKIRLIFHIFRESLYVIGVGLVMEHKQKQMNSIVFQRSIAANTDEKLTIKSSNF